MELLGPRGNEDGMWKGRKTGPDKYSEKVTYILRNSKCM